VKHFLYSLAIVACSASAAAQEPYVYVAKIVGNWVVADKSQGGIRVLDRVPVSATIGVRAADSVTKAYTLVLRDPRTLKTATLSCDPTVRCRASRRVSALSFTGPAIATTPRTGQLFVHVAEGDEARGRVTLLGARGGGQDWGLVVLGVDSGRIDLAPLRDRIGAVQSQLVVRLCLVGGAADVGGECQRGTTARPGDCALDTAAACPASANGNATRPATLVVFERDGPSLGSAPVGFAMAVIASPAQFKQSVALAGDYARDLAALQDRVSKEEFESLELAAAAAIAGRKP
jgi:hypothetical protein